MSDSTRPRRAAAADGLLVLGLVGRAGSGKSSVARALAARGGVVLDADRIGHEVTDADPEVRAALLAEYGPAVYLEDGALNLGRWGDKDASKVMDQIVASPSESPVLRAMACWYSLKIQGRTKEAARELAKMVK